MATNARIITRRTRSEIEMDRVTLDIIQRLRDSGEWEKDFEYFGLGDSDRADEIRRSFRRSARKVKPERVSVKAFWRECQGCEQGGRNCRYHVVFAIYDFEKARAYVAAKQDAASKAVPDYMPAKGEGFQQPA